VDKGRTWLKGIVSQWRLGENQLGSSYPEPRPGGVWGRRKKRSPNEKVPKKKGSRKPQEKGVRVFGTREKETLTKKGTCGVKGS